MPPPVVVLDGHQGDDLRAQMSCLWVSVMEGDRCSALPRRAQNVLCPSNCSQTALFHVARIFGACSTKKGRYVNQDCCKSMNCSATTKAEQGHLLLGEWWLI